jgi:serine/threonine-protein kinase
MRAVTSSACLQHDTVVALIAGQLMLDHHPQIEAHLAECSICQMIVAAAAAGLDDSQGGPPGKGQHFPKPGDMLAGKYQVVGVLGRGGMGTVFAATHGELGRSVAIKVLHCTASTADARFLREAKISAQLVSEHTARVFDFGSTADGAPFLVMEHLAGEDLSRVIARGPVSSVLAVEYALQICVALAEAHEAGVVHRDLKPSNVFVTHRADGSPCLKVLDFGISKLLTPGEVEKSQNLTEAHSLLGSPAYMSPEQLRESKDVDSRSDIWSLGVVLYELLTAERPFQALSISGVSAAIAADAPRPPSVANPAVPTGVDRVVMRCLRKDVKERFASVGDVAEALRAATAPPKKTSAWRTVLAAVGAAAVAASIIHLLAPQPSEVIPTAIALPAQPLPAQPLPAQPLPHTAAQRLSVHCDLPLPPGDIRLHAPASMTGGELDRRWSLRDVCDVSAPDAPRVELARALAGSAPRPDLTLEPPQPCYQIHYRVDAPSSATEPVLHVERLDRCPAQLTLAGAGCDTVQQIEITADGAKLSVQTSPREGAANLKASCQLGVELPFEAYGQMLSFQLRPAEYSAPNVRFTSSALTLAIERRAVPPVSTRSQRPKPCVPPDYCRN